MEFMKIEGNSDQHRKLLQQSFTHFRNKILLGTLYISFKPLRYCKYQGYIFPTSLLPIKNKSQVGLYFNYHDKLLQCNKIQGHNLLLFVQCNTYLEDMISMQNHLYLLKFLNLL